MMNQPRIEQATLEDLPQLTDLLFALFEQEADFVPDRVKQARGLRLILENPTRGRIFVLREHDRILGMINLLITISTAEGGFVILLEDLVIDKDFRRHGYGMALLQHAIDYAKAKGFLRITLLTDIQEKESHLFYKKAGFIDSSMIPLRLLLADR